MFIPVVIPPADLGKTESTVGGAAGGAGGDDASPSHDPGFRALLRRFGVCGPVYLRLPSTAFLAGGAATTVSGADEGKTAEGADDESPAEPSIQAVKPYLSLAACHVGPVPLSAVDAAANYLDAGAATIVLDGSSPHGDLADVADVAEIAGQLPRERVLVQAPVGAYSVGDGTVTDLSKWITAVSEFASGGVILRPSTPEAAASWASLSSADARVLRRGPDGTQHAAIVMISFDLLADSPGEGVSDVSVESLGDSTMLVGALHRDSISVVGFATIDAPETAVSPVEATASGFDAPAITASPGSPVLSWSGVTPCTHVFELAASFAACARTDRPDKLYTTVVTDERGIALGLVYSSTSSICEAIRASRGIYYSRSRGGLWRKGDTSGAVQLLSSVSLDCDSDAVLFRVCQLGEPPAFCHLQTRTCWGEDRGLSHLERLLASRLASAPEGSYTKRLFDDPELLRHKLLEEAQELIEATDPDHVAAEAADVLYFAMVRCAAAGVKLVDIEGHLARRALKIKRRPGNAKAARIAAAEKYLAAGQEAKADEGGADE